MSIKIMNNILLDLNDVIVSYDSIIIESVKVFREFEIEVKGLTSFFDILNKNEMTEDYTNLRVRKIKDNNFILRNFFYENYEVFKENKDLLIESNIVKYNMDTMNILSTSTCGSYLVLDNLFSDNREDLLLEIAINTLCSFIEKKKILTFDSLFNHLSDKMFIDVKSTVLTLYSSDYKFKDKIAESFLHEYHKRNNKLYDKKLEYLHDTLKIASLILHENKETVNFYNEIKKEQEKTNKDYIYTIAVLNLFNIKG